MNKFMEIAIKEAMIGIKKDEGGPFGAVIEKDGKLISKAHNIVVLSHDSTCHAEMEAIRKASAKLGKFDLSGCKIYTTGYPCPMCFGAILWANIDKIYYGCNTTDTENIGFRDKCFGQSIKKLGKTMSEEIDRKECLNLYKVYENLDSKTNY